MNFSHYGTGDDLKSIRSLSVEAAVEVKEGAGIFVDLEFLCGGEVTVIAGDRGYAEQIDFALEVGNSLADLVAADSETGVAQ